MTTLHVERDRLDEVVAGYPVVRALEIRTDFPHGMTIRVIEHEPAAMAVTGGGRVPVAADGTVLEGLPVSGRLPVVRSAGGIKGARLAAGAALGAVRIAGAAPAPLRRRVREIERDGERGYVARLRKGPEIFFGGATHLRAKWIAAARVLADPETRGATYVDVRLPDTPGRRRPAGHAAHAGAHDRPARGPRRRERTRGRHCGAACHHGAGPARHERPCDRAGAPGRGARDHGSGNASDARCAHRRGGRGSGCGALSLTPRAVPRGRATTLDLGLRVMKDPQLGVEARLHDKLRDPLTFRPIATYSPHFQAVADPRRPP